MAETGHRWVGFGWAGAEAGGPAALGIMSVHPTLVFSGFLSSCSRYRFQASASTLLLDMLLLGRQLISGGTSPRPQATGGGGSRLGRAWIWTLQVPLQVSAITGSEQCAW